MGLVNYSIRRLLLAVFLVWAVSVIVFFLMHLSGGDPVQMLAGLNAPKHVVERIREEWGFNDPVYVQYWHWFARAIRLDFGQSVMSRLPVSEVIMSRLPNTLSLNFWAYLVAITLAIPIGVISALKQYSIFDHVGTVVALLGISMPNFWLGLMLIIFLALNVDWLPSSGTGSWRHFILPAITLGTAQAAALMRMVRSSVIETLREDYVRTARAKGLSEQVVLYKHVFKNAAIPVVTLMGFRLAYIVSGSVITETIFAWPGVGRLTIQALHSRDFFVVQGIVLMLSTVIILANLVVDLSYALLDPRIRYD